MKQAVFISLIIMLSGEFAFSQKAKPSYLSSEAIEKWNRAVFAINGTDHNSVDTTSGHGTGIFLKYKNRHYILTARHVLAKAATDKLYTKFLLIDDISNFKNPIYDPIGNGNVISHDERPPGLMNYSYGITLSNVDTDLGIIALDSVGPESQGPHFLKLLYRRGYNPITMEDIDIDCNISQNDQIWAMGYPRESIQSIKGIPEAITNWRSPSKSITFITGGTIDETNPRPGHFYANIFVYRGFSGGPIIHNGKLVGIVSRSDPKVISNKSPKLNSVVHLKIVISKSSNFMEWLNRAIEKEKSFLEMARRPKQ